MLGHSDIKLEAIVIGASTGGVSALMSILGALPAGFGPPLVIVQHQRPDAKDRLARALDGKTAIRVKEADEKESITPGTAYLAPANYHLLIEDDRTFSLSVEEKVNFSRPSIDVLFESAADVYGPGLLGIILTGASIDGSQGLLAVKDGGGLTVVQDPESAEMDMMPLAAIKTADPDYILNLHEIGWLLSGLTGDHDVRSQ